MVELCYACDALKSSSEHAPPRCLFPKADDAGKDLRKNLISVPSCDAHNSAKSTDDQYLWFVLTTNHFANQVGQRHAAGALFRAHERRPALGNSIASQARSAAIRSPQTGATEEAGIAAPLDGPRFDRILQLVARALHLHHFGERWLGPLRVLCDFIAHDEDAETEALRGWMYSAAETNFAHEQRHGENPEVFWYSVSDSFVARMMRLCFYGGCTATVFFEFEPDYRGGSIQFWIK